MVDGELNLTHTCSSKITPHRLLLSHKAKSIHWRGSDGQHPIQWSFVASLMVTEVLYIFWHDATYATSYTSLRILTSSSQETENGATNFKIPQERKQRNSKGGTFYKITGLFNKSVLAKTDHMWDRLRANNHMQRMVLD